MSGYGIQVATSGIPEINAYMQKLAGINESSAFYNALGAEAEKQIKRRISDEKTSPDGKKWDKWSDDYADTRHGGHSLLEGEGHLRDNIYQTPSVSGVEVGSNTIYAAVMHFGAEKHEFKGIAPWGNIPPREFMGLSDENIKDQIEVISDWYTGLLS